MRFFIPLFLLMAAGIVQADAIIVEQAYARASIPGQSNAAAFVVITNQQQHPVSLTALDSDAANQVELHTHQHSNGTMQMRKVENLQLEPGQTLDLKKEDMHLMLMGLETPLQQGKQISITFCFDEDCMDVDFPVISIKTETQGQHHHHH